MIGFLLLIACSFVVALIVVRAVRAPSITALWNAFGWLIRASELVDHKIVKACAALAVGALAFGGLFMHCESLKLVASALGMVLPLVYLVSLFLSGPIADWLGAKLDAQGES